MLNIIKIYFFSIFLFNNIFNLFFQFINESNIKFYFILQIIFIRFFTYIFSYHILFKFQA